MTIPVFLELVEIKAKTASVLPFLLGICYSWYHYQVLNIGYVLLYFIAMFLFNLAVDMLDNYNDYHKASGQHEYKEKTNIIGREALDAKFVLRLAVLLIVFSAAIGIGLAFAVGWPLLLLGAYCYAVGIFYSSGPRPLSSLPLGEFFSGSTMGFMITLICVYLNTYQLFVWDWRTLGQISLLTLPNVLWIANLMLANNICDLEEDEENRRYTLVHYLGRSRSLQLFSLFNILAFAATAVAVWLRIVPVILLGTFLLVPFVKRQTQQFLKKQVKTETFSCAVKILAVGAFVQLILFVLGIVLS